MNGPPPRILALLLTTVGAGLALQLGLVVFVLHGGVALALGAIASTVLCCTLAVRLLRRVLRPLALESLRVQEMAIGWENEGAFGTPSLLDTDETLSEVERLRRELFHRREQSQRLRKRAEEASAYKTGFLKSVQHELRTPLNAILGFAEVLLSGIEGPLTLAQRENLGVIRTTGKRLQDLFDEVIELAAAAGAELGPQRVAIELGPLLERLGVTLEEERIDKPAHIRVELADNLPAVGGDEAQIARLLKGIANQSLAVMNGPLLVIAAEAHGEHVRVSVRDPARRLSPEEVAALTGPVPSAVRRKGLDEGSRLRIALWRQLAQLFEGTLVFASGERGTEYVLELPLFRPS